MTLKLSFRLFGSVEFSASNYFGRRRPATPATTHQNKKFRASYDVGCLHTSPCGERRKNRGIIKDRMLEAKLFLTAVDFSMATSLSYTHSSSFCRIILLIFIPKRGGSRGWIIEIGRGDFVISSLTRPWRSYISRRRPWTLPKTNYYSEYFYANLYATYKNIFRSIPFTPL